MSRSVKIRYMLTTQPVCSGCNFPLDVYTTTPCMNCGQHADPFIPGVVLECDWQHADVVPPEHVLPNILAAGADRPETAATREPPCE